MGAKPTSAVYSVEVPNQVQPSNQTKTRRNPQFVNYLWSSPNDSRSLKELFNQSFKNFAKRKCFGKRLVNEGTIKRAEISQTIKESSVSKPSVEYFTYQQVAEMVECVARSILANNLVGEVSPT
jgi:hypothetical protein